MKTDDALRSAADAARDISGANLAGDTATYLGKSAPPLAVATATIGGMPLEQWVYVATLVYLLLQAAHLLWKWRRDLRLAALEDGRDG